MNDIVRPIDRAGNIGYDEYNKLILKVRDPEGRTIIYHTPDLRNETCSLCGKKWFLTSGCWDNHWFWSTHKEHVHETCYVRYLGLKDRDHFYLCALYSIRFEKLIAVPNRYHPGGRWSKRSWYQVDSTDGPVRFTIGHRKRVVHIEVTPTEGKLGWWLRAKEAFEGEEVTKHFSEDRVYVHSWKPENDKRYMRVLAESAGVAR